MLRTRIRTAILLWILTFPLAAHAQVGLPVPLLLTGDSTHQQQVVGLATASDRTDGVSTDVARHGTIVSAIASGVDTLAVTIIPPPLTYVPGMHLVIVPTAVNTGPVMVDISALGPVPMVKHLDLPLDSADLRPGIPADVVFDGAVFQWINATQPACPPGYFAVSREVCVQSTWNDPLHFYAANTYCAGRNARLCSMSEWYRGCSMPGGFLPTMTELEWVDHAANDTNLAKNVGFDSVNGVLGCKFGGHSPPLGLFRFRCCYDR